MNKIKDIIYNKSDIIIAILILAIAALIIFWRLGIILEYPKQLIGTDEASEVLTEPENTSQTQTNTGTDAASENNTGDAAQTGEDSTKPAEGEANTGDTETTDDSVTVTKAAEWDGDVLAKDLEVTLVGTTATEAVQCLVDAGVFADYAEYDSICDDIGYDDEKMKSGVFTFAKGSTREDIIKAVNWS